ncbi:LysR family transcriptional regulator [Streptomyces drozdowiczii]|uniref:LysR family transcriptional regulator n=1 Tax=Streptomyces drozdowiczii TaxID=202862 RepID=A0ABY6PWF9_9ACTN|nr:LysR family transcriptional regulator [Streptomyces drozdowiczii]MCX0243652.1 LysR family transcriptional regulator [Streptomyces drozdowiczii]UZK56457.1 LysR family transcriptional regulator [Streptomyces drozdowiczii]
MRVTQSGLDLNLLVALDVLLDECSVSGAAARLHLSEPAMSRTLGRIRKALGDPVLVRAGRTMVPTPHALAIHGEVRAVVERARGLFLSGGKVDLRALSRTFTVLAQDTLAAVSGPALFARIAREAPGVRLRFLMESHVDGPFLREGAADLEVGVLDVRSPEVHREHLYNDRMVGVVRADHPLLEGEITPARFAAADHLTVSRRGRTTGPVDTALAGLGLSRRVVASVGTLPSSLFILLSSDLVGLTSLRARPLTETLGLRTFEIPFPLPPLPFGMAWHPRHDADPAHAWLRERFRQLAREEAPEDGDENPLFPVPPGG